ncbi:hypothetical protein CRM22_008074 [Opisthorchis felineus]|uniref:ISXO2-like transposase domain-containing protein n=1 Tax=Opisthorchis felineus TaxID=147828 RepID=A0A4S2LDA2_OPIFE|nr:hypothetical protein CRM22_008074 [Opisthorchis felineus]
MESGINEREASIDDQTIGTIASKKLLVTNGISTTKKHSNHLTSETAAARPSFLTHLLRGSRRVSRKNRSGPGAATSTDWTADHVRSSWLIHSVVDPDDTVLQTKPHASDALNAPITLDTNQSPKGSGTDVSFPQSEFKSVIGLEGATEATEDFDGGTDRCCSSTRLSLEQKTQQNEPTNSEQVLSQPANNQPSNTAETASDTPFTETLNFGECSGSVSSAHSGMRTVNMKRRRTRRVYFDSESDTDTLPATGCDMYECTTTPIAKRAKTVSTIQRKRRTAIKVQCLENLYGRLPTGDAAKLLNVAVYDRVESICKQPYTSVDQWLADGFPKCFDICELISQPTRLVIWLAKRKLIMNRIQCASCQRPMLIKCAPFRRQMYIWACRFCGQRSSIRLGSAFMKTGVPEANIILILYLWSLGYSVEFCGTELECSLTSARCYIWMAVRSAAAELQRNFRPISGIVEIEWENFLRTTAHRDGLFLLCGVERSTKKVFAVRCPEPHNKDALQSIIQQNVSPGSIIITRDRSMFTQLQLPLLGYPHYFLDGAHETALDDVLIDLTLVDNFIEGIRSHIRKQGGPGVFWTELLLTEMLIRRTWGESLFPMLLYSIARSYNVQS